MLLMVLPKNIRLIILSGMRFMKRWSQPFSGKRQLKEWQHSWKLKLIEEFNPDWRDLYDTLF